MLTEETDAGAPGSYNTTQSRIRPCAHQLLVPETKYLKISRVGVSKADVKWRRSGGAGGGKMQAQLESGVWGSEPALPGRTPVSASNLPAPHSAANSSTDSSTRLGPRCELIGGLIYRVRAPEESPKPHF